MILLSVATPHEEEAIINPETIECLRPPTEAEQPAGAVIQFTSGLTLRVRDSLPTLLNRILDASTSTPPGGRS